MVTYPIRLSEELYRKLQERAKKEGHSLAVLLRESAAAAAGNPSTNALLSMIRESIAKSSCSSTVNRATLMAIVETLSRGNFDSESFERTLKAYDAMLYAVQHLGIEDVNELRKFVHKTLEKESEGK